MFDVSMMALVIVTAFLAGMFVGYVEGRSEGDE